MALNRFKLALNSARFPLLASQATQPVLVPALDIAPKSQSRAFFGAEESADFNVPNILYGENFMPYAYGLKSVSYTRVVSPNADLTALHDQAFQLRDQFENAVLFSPSKGKNYVYSVDTTAWTANDSASLWAAETAPLYLSSASEHTLDTAKITRAYVDGRTFVCYSRLSLTDVVGGATEVSEGSILGWRPTDSNFRRIKTETNTDLIRNLSIPIGEIDGISNSNGFLLVWSGLTVYWAAFDGTAFDYQIYANGSATGSGNQIPEDVKGPITAVVPVSGGFIIFTNKNAVAAQYNSSNTLAPWIFREISNAGGVESFEQIGVETALGALFAYTTGGLQRITLNSAESFSPDVSDFLGGRLVESFELGDYTIQPGEITTDFFVKLNYIASRFLVVSYGMYPDLYSFALVYDSALQRWGKLRITHKDCIYFYAKAIETNLTYAMALDIPYDSMDTTAYEDATVMSSGITYPRQAIGFLLESGEVKLAVMDNREVDSTDTSDAFVVIGKVQLHRNSTTVLHTVEISGIKPGGTCSVYKSLDGHNLEQIEHLTLRQQVGEYSEWGADLVTGKNYAVFVRGQFSMSSIVMQASQDAHTY